MYNSNNNLKENVTLDKVFFLAFKRFVDNGAQCSSSFPYHAVRENSSWVLKTLLHVALCNTTQSILCRFHLYLCHGKLVGP